MAYSLRRSYKSILATSSTTALAFLSSGFSSLMPVSAFGYFAFLNIPVNYVLIIFYFPCFLVIYERTIRSYELSFCENLGNCFTCMPCRKFIVFWS